MARTVFRTCTLCEATCGLRFEVEGQPHPLGAWRRGRRLLAGIRLSEGDRDRRRAPRPGPLAAARAPHRGGAFEPISWDDALDLAARRLQDVRAQHGNDAIGFYWGNPTGNNHGALLLISSFTKAIGTRNRFSAGSQDANPRVVTSYLPLRLVGHDPRPRRRPYRLLPLSRRQSAGLERQRHDGARHARAGSAPCARAAARWSSSIRAAPRPRRRPTSTSRSDPGGDAALLLAMAQVLVDA